MELGSNFLWGLGILIAVVLVFTSMKKTGKDKDHAPDDSSVAQTHDGDDSQGE
jgi:hypothetical protein